MINPSSEMMVSRIQAQPVQLILPIARSDAATFETFFIGPNDELARSLDAISAGEAGPFIYFWGGDGHGKTHLLQAICHRVTESGAAAAYVPLATFESMSPQLLEGLENLAVVCLDDIQAIAGSPVWEEAIFDLYNRVRELDKPLVVCGHSSPAGLGLKLPDLESRLAWGLTYQLHALEDTGKLAALRLRARRRGFDLPVAAGRYLLQRFPRDMHTLFGLLDQLDVASLSAQRQLTVPFIRRVLAC